jgi:citrate lyase beta subunit
MKPSLSPRDLRAVAARLSKAHRAFAAAYPGPSGRRQPVHTVYGGAHLFKADSARRLGELAQRALDEYAPDPITFAKAIGLPGALQLSASPAEAARLEARLEAEPDSLQQGSPAAWLAATIYRRVREKLHREPVEDFRIDFEDGYGNRPDAEEDGHAAAAAAELAAGMAAGSLPPFIGIRVKPLSEDLRERSIRTCDIFLTALVREAGGKLPGNFVITLPKVTLPEEVAALVELLGKLERKLRLPAGALQVELMIETTQSILNWRGESSLPHLVAAARGRCVAAHFGTYDYTAACNITAAHQTMTHPACDFAKHMMQVALGGTGIWLSDGATNIMPVPPHRAAKGGTGLTPAQVEENRRTVHRAWKLHYEHIQHSLIGGFYQGWDLHPAQLPTRYAAVYSFFLQSLDAAAERLRNFVGRAAQATLVGEVFDDAATGQGLLNYFLRAINCGAISEDEALPLTGLAAAELRFGSFVKILKNRTGR